MGWPGVEAQHKFGWWHAHRYLLLRRLSQLSVIGLFLLGPLTGVWLIKGSLSSSLLLDTIPMTDPLLMAQLLAAGQWPLAEAFIGTAVVIGLYALLGGRVFCSWVCPVNVVTDAAHWLHRKLGLKGRLHLARSSRLWLLGAVLLTALFVGQPAWEWLNPVSLASRLLIFGLYGGLLALLLLGLFDLLLMRRGWCGHLCPLGALYGELGRVAPLRVGTPNRAACNDCMECFEVCPEPQVIRPALKGEGPRVAILDGHCTNCGRCIDVCSQHVFAFGGRTAVASEALKNLKRPEGE